MKKKIQSLSIGSFLMVICMHLFSVEGRADVIYTDVTDQTFTQTTIGFQTYSIDLNNDAVVDFTLRVEDGINTVPQGSFDGESVTIISGAGNAVLDDGSLGRYARALVFNDNIQSSSTTWETYSGVLSADGDLTVTSPVVLTTPVIGGNFTNTTDKFIGVKLLIGSNTHYGWIRVDVTNYNSFTIKAFAYESLADQAIFAGSIPTGISDYLTRTTVVKNIDNGLMIEFEKTFEGTVELLSVGGTVVLSKEINSVSCTINTNSLSSGIYNIVIRNNSDYASKKVLIQN